MANLYAELSPETVILKRSLRTANRSFFNMGIWRRNWYQGQTIQLNLLIESDS